MADIRQGGKTLDGFPPLLFVYFFDSFSPGCVDFPENLLYNKWE